MTGFRLRRALVGLVVAFAALVASPATAEAKPKPELTDKKVDPFCIGITGTWVEACIGSPYSTIRAVVRMAGRGMPL